MQQQHDEAIDLSLWQRERARRARIRMRRRRLIISAGLATLTAIVLLLALVALGKVLMSLGAVPETREQRQERRSAAATAALLKKLCAQGLIHDAQRCADLPSDEELREMRR